MGRKRFYAGAVLISCMLTLCGCSLKQEDDKSAILVTNDAASSYEMTQAQKGKIQKTKVLVANYQQVRSENLSFRSNGRRLEGVYVAMGDTVEKGDLLAEVYCDDEKKELANLEYRIKTQEMKIEHLQEQKELELTWLARKKGSMTSAEYEASVAEVEDRYRIQTEDLEDSIYVERMQYDELYWFVEGCKIYATMDGTITYLRDTGSSFVSWGGNKVLTISDSAECAFLCDDVEYASYFTVGDCLTGQSVEFLLYLGGDVCRSDLVGHSLGILGLIVEESLFGHNLRYREEVLSLARDQHTAPHLPTCDKLLNQNIIALLESLLYGCCNLLLICHARDTEAAAAGIRLHEQGKTELLNNGLLVDPVATM